MIFFCKQKTAYEMRISDWSSDVCSSDLRREERQRGQGDRTYQEHEEHACDEIAVAKECALEQRPSGRCEMNHGDPESGNRNAAFDQDFPALEPVFAIGRASCRERVCQYV